MNKKKLSVVMAGAMLASSVAPVLAADSTTVTEYAKSNTALLANEVKTLMESEMISTNGALKDTRFTNSGVSDLMVANASAYGVVTYNADGSEKNALTYNVTTAVTNIKGLEVGQSVKVYRRATTEFKGELIPGSTINVLDSTVETYKASELITTGSVNSTLNAATTINGSSKIVAGVAVNTATTDDENDIKITLNALDSNGQAKTIVLTSGDKKLDFNLAYDKDGNLLDATSASDVQKFDHFGELVKTYQPSVVMNKKELKNTYKIVKDSNSDETLSVSDLYDGFALTSKGTEILSDLVNAAENAEEKIGTTSGKALVLLSDKVDNSKKEQGIYSFTVTYKKKTGPSTTENVKTITVTSNKEKDITSLYNLLKSGEFNVGIVAGANRYETAVNVAKANKSELKIDNADGDTSALGANDIYNNNIVIVNGESLVDGLSAAPLAASLNKVGTTAAQTATNVKQAPVLLSKADSLPTATKEYIEELANDISTKARKNYVITLVGGESVLSENLVNEIEGMGFTVKRLGGDNREETSIEVAEKLSTTNGVFVVGGEGEADAMSIAAVAANKKAPIIVSKKGGISKDALNYLEDNANDQVVRIIGGETVLTKADEEKINAKLDKNNAAYRIAGSNRQATNAAVIKEYYNANAIKTSTGVVLVKDGQSNKSELIDALSAANYASSMNAPIVLGTSKVTDAQKNALLNIDGTVNKVAQVGEGANRTLLESIAEASAVTLK